MIQCKNSIKQLTSTKAERERLILDQTDKSKMIAIQTTPYSVNKKNLMLID